MWKKLGKAIGKGLAWLVRNPEAIGGIIEGIKQVKDRTKR